MDQHPQPENPYSSPNAGSSTNAAGRVTGAVWEDKRVTIDFERTLEDYVISEWFRMQHHRSRGREILRLAVIFAGTLIAVWVLSELMGGLNVVVLTVAIAYFAILVWALSMRRRLRMVRRIINRVVTSDAQEYLIPVRVTFSEDGFDASSQWERRLRRWSAVGRLIELGDFYLFVHGGVVTLVIPKRAFAGPDERQRFLDWIRAYIPVAPG